MQKVDRLINYLEVNEIKTDNGQVLQTSISHSYHNLNNILLLALCSELFGRNISLTYAYNLDIFSMLNPDKKKVLMRNQVIVKYTNVEKKYSKGF